MLVRGDNSKLRQTLQGVRGLRGLRGLRSLKRLGCACSKSIVRGRFAALGYTGPYDASLDDSNPLPVYGPPAPTAQDIAFDKGYAAAGVAPNPAYAFQPPSAPSSGIAFPVFNNPAASPLSVPGMTIPTMNVASAAPSSASSLSAYIPYALLGLGAIAFVSALKRR